MKMPCCCWPEWGRIKPEIGRWLIQSLSGLILLAGCFFAGTAFAYEANILVSNAPDRSDASALADQTVKGNVYIFASLGFKAKVSFYIDDPNRTLPRYSRDRRAPYDLVGGKIRKAKPFDTSSLSDGEHTLTIFVKSKSIELVVHSTFTVKNQVSGQLTPSAETLVFAEQVVGATSGSQSVTLTNTGQASVNVHDVAVSGDFKWTTNTCGTISVGGDCTVSVSFSPIAAGTRNGTLTIFSDAENDPLAVGLSGIGATPMVDIRLLWDPSQDAVTDYNVYYGPTADAIDTLYVSLSTTQIDSQAPSVDLTIEDGAPMCFGVNAANDFGESGLSNVVCIN